MVEQTAKDLSSLCSTAEEQGSNLEQRLKVFPQEFEKDDDANGHIDFVTAASVSCVNVRFSCNAVKYCSLQVGWKSASCKV